MRHFKKYVCCIHLFMDLLQKRFLFNLLSIYCCTERLVHHYFLLLRYLTFWCIHSFWSLMHWIFSKCSFQCARMCTGQSCRVTSVVKTSLHKYFWSGWFQRFIAVSPPILSKELQAPRMLRAAAFSSNCITSTHQAKELGMSVLLHTITSSLPISVLRSNV